MTILSCGFKVKLDDIQKLRGLMSSMLSIENPNDMISLCCETNQEWERSLNDARESDTEFAIIQIPTFNIRTDRFMWELLIYRTRATTWGLLAFRATIKSARFCA